MSQSILVRVDAVIAGAVFRTIARNWKDTITILGLAAFLVGGLVSYSTSVSEANRYYAALASAGALGFGIIFFALSRIDRHSDGSPFALDSLDFARSRFYLLTWGLLSLLIAIALGVVIAPGELVAVTAVWAAAAATGYFAFRLPALSSTLQGGRSVMPGRQLRTLVGYAALALAIGGILFEAVTDGTAEATTILIVAANAVAAGLLTPVKPDEVRFFRIMGGGYAGRCVSALRPLLGAVALQVALIWLLVRDLPLLAMVALVVFGIILYRAVQIGLLRFMPARAAELVLSFGLLALLMLGFSFPPLIAVFLAATVTFVGYRAWRANWLLQ